MSHTSNQDQLLEWLNGQYAEQTEYLQAVDEIVNDIMPVANVHDLSLIHI